MILQQESDHEILSSYTRTLVTVIFQFLLPGLPSCVSTTMHLFFFSQKNLIAQKWHSFPGKTQFFIKNMFHEVARIGHRKKISVLISRYNNAAHNGKHWTFSSRERINQWQLLLAQLNYSTLFNWNW